eukprot:CAMPEP_0170470402 /NCGR_PEP_ID=MMETSP0123-20130129/12872_1 /TAXON_ID=182087 /ORGANISM="Favella ehrenbergii, Strain Fehren 1" /LENGTH=43 /DNA_ID= /DNA_START= /DNA_END= /DNA_ORIENTATION=
MAAHLPARSRMAHAAAPLRVSVEIEVRLTDLVALFSAPHANID